MTINGALTTAFIATHLAVLWIVPVALLPSSPLAAMTLLFLLAITSNTLWSLVHEAIHGHLADDRWCNDAAGRVLAILHGGVFAALREGHLLHHRFNRTAKDRTEVYDPATTSHLRAAIGYYPILLGGLYLLELVGSLTVFLPRRALARLSAAVTSGDSMRGEVVGAVLGRCLSEARIDAVLLLAFHGGAAYLWRAQIGWFIGFAMLRALVISLADNAFHYGTRLDVRQSALDLDMPRSGSALLLHFPLHGAHHRAPALGWRQLPAAAVVAGAPGWFGALARQLRGPIALDDLPGYRDAAANARASPASGVG